MKISKTDQFIVDVAFFIVMMVLAVGGSFVMWMGVIVAPIHLGGVLLFLVGAAAICTFGKYASELG